MKIKLPETKAWTDRDIMPWGKFAGQPMEKVPAWYLDKLRDALALPFGLRLYIEKNAELIDRELQEGE